MSAFYDDLRQTAADMIAEFGTMVTLVRETASFYDPIGDAQTVATTLYTIQGVILSRGTDDLAAGYDDLTLAGKVKVMLPALGLPVDPAPGDKLILPGDTARYVVTDVKQTRPDGEDVMFSVFAVRGGSAI